MSKLIQSTGRKFDQHPLSAAFPPMSKEDLRNLLEDIKVNGQLEPIVVYEGKVLDGWHRYRCMQTLAMPVNYVDLPEPSIPSAFAWARNGARRQMTASQRAGTITRLMKLGWAPLGRPVKAKPATDKAKGAAAKPAPTKVTVKEMAKEAAVSTRTIEQAVQAEKAGLGNKVISGELTAKQAAALAKPATPKPTVAPPNNSAPGAELPEKPVADQEDTDEFGIAAVQKLDAAQLAELAHGDWTLDAAEKVIEHLRERVDALTADSTKAELDKYVSMYHAADHRAWQESDKARRMEKLAGAYYSNLLSISKLIGGKAELERTGSKIVTMVRKLVAKVAP
jgi:ParB-like chromosome segregation protein Spo0J